ncbi:MAG: HD domain-containing protein [Dehalococcoidales bacterium]|nr:HD domain-containing protein [Dehalococcoidales bacterium]
MSHTQADPKNTFGSMLGSEVKLILDRVSDIIIGQCVESYIVGGLVRDALLGRDTADIDLAVAPDALEIAPRVAGALGGKYVLLDRENRIGRVILPDSEPAPCGRRWELDFSTLAGDIEHDLARRDFTINAMAVDLGQLRQGPAVALIIDPFYGQEDLKQGVIRAVNESSLPADAVRLLRAVRLVAELGFSIDPETEAQIRHHSSLITTIAGERIKEELLRLLAFPGNERILTYLDDLGLLTEILPPLAAAKGIEQPKEHFWDVFEHSLKTVTAVDFLLRQGRWEYADGEVIAAVPWSATLAGHFAQEVSGGSTRRTLLKLAALLHDVAKPQTKSIEAGGRVRFLGHALDGASIAAGLLAKLRFSAREIKLVETLIQHHLRPGQMSQGQLPTHRAIYRYFRDSGDAGIDTLFLSLADHLAARGPGLDLSHWQEHARTVEYVLSRRFEQESIVHPPKLVDGHDLINIFDINPGPEVGVVLEAVREAQASGEVTTREEALKYIEKLLEETAGK